MKPHRLILAGFLVVLLAITLNGYAGRDAIVASQRSGCERGIPTRIDQINVAWAEALANSIAAALIPRQSLSGSSSGAYLSRRLAVAREGEASQQRTLAETQAILIPPSDARLIPVSVLAYPTPGVLP